LGGSSPSSAIEEAAADQENLPTMIANPLALRLDVEQPLREQIRVAAKAGARGVVVDAAGDLAPHRLSETGRRELRHLLRSADIALTALNLPTRRPFDQIDQLDDRIRRAVSAFAMAFELGTNLVLARVGSVPPEETPERREIFVSALRELARRADHHGVRLAVETGADPGSKLRNFLDSLDQPTLAASIDPASLLRSGIDPVQAVRELESWVAHAYANDATDAPGASSTNPRGYGFPPGSLDWEEYLGSLEEIGYRGFLTVWPGPELDPIARFRTIRDRLNFAG
jgi:sugar phosphate isomerase/epimerase